MVQQRNEAEVKGRMRKAREIHLDGEQKAELGALAKSGRTTQRLAQRCRIVLGAAEGMTDEAIGKEERVSRQKAGFLAVLSGNAAKVE
ncbi:MAG: hypothetical protein LBD01_05095 [Puniceicoccales bacterium]|jgi:hypothetical protein|nr:hypothetical protein [Puniceicoccales bacterium]